MQRTSELRSGGLGRLETPSLQDSVSIPRQLSDRVSQLIQVIQPSRASEDRRLAIADYVRRLIVKCFQPDHKVEAFMFGSVPLRTYLPDGDIDVSIFCEAKNLQNTWCEKLSTVLESEAENLEAEFKITNVSLINAEVKLLKCLVDNIVVDVSFNQIGGLCTLVFLEAMDRRIGNKHLFKRSVILIKAWCYYESRVLGAQHSLLSTYALETMVLYIFNVYHSELQTPLEVLYKFLIVFHHFEWDKYCLTLFGPVSLKTLDTSTSVPPIEHGSNLLFPNFLNVMQEAYSYTPVVPTNSKGPGYPKCINIMDPLLHSNNLGRSVSKTSEIRIRNAFGHGARLLHQLFPKEVPETFEAIDCFFKNTWMAQRRPRMPLESQVPRPQSSALSIEQQPNQEVQTGNYILELLKDQNNREMAIPLDQEGLASIPGIPGFPAPFPPVNGNSTQQNNNFGPGGGIFPPPPPHGGTNDRMIGQHPVHGVRNAAELEKLVRPIQQQPIRSLFDNQVTKPPTGGANTGAFCNPLDPCYQLMQQFHHQHPHLLNTYPPMKGFPPHQQVGPIQGVPTGRQGHSRDNKPALTRAKSAPNIGEYNSKKKDKSHRNFNLTHCFNQCPRTLPPTSVLKLKKEDLGPLKQDIPSLTTPSPVEKEIRKPPTPKNKSEDLTRVKNRLRLDPELLEKLNAMEAKRTASELEKETKKSPQQDSEDTSNDPQTSPVECSLPEPVNPPSEKTLINEEAPSNPERTELSPLPALHDQSIVIGEPPEPAMVTLDDFPNRIDREFLSGINRNPQRRLRRPTEFQQGQQINSTHPGELRTPLIRPGMGHRQAVVERGPPNIQPMLDLNPGTADFHQNPNFNPVYSYMMGHPHHYPQAPPPNHLYGTMTANGPPPPHGAEMTNIQQLNGAGRPTGAANQATSVRPQVIQKPPEQGSLADLFTASYQQISCFRNDAERRLNGGNAGWNFGTNCSPVPSMNASILTQQRGGLREDGGNPRETDDVLSGDIENLTQHLEVAKNFVGRKPTNERNGGGEAPSSGGLTPTPQGTVMKKTPPPPSVRQETSKTPNSNNRDRPPNPLRTAPMDAGNPPFTASNHHLPFPPGPYSTQMGSNVLFQVQNPGYVSHPTLEGVPTNEMDLLKQLHVNAGAVAPTGYVLQGAHPRGMHVPSGMMPLHLPSHPQPVVGGNLPMPPPPPQQRTTTMRPSRETSVVRGAGKEVAGSRRINEEEQKPMCVEIDGGKRVEIDASIIQAVEAALAGKGTSQDDSPQPMIREDSTPCSPRFQPKETVQIRAPGAGHEIPTLAATRCQLEEGVVSYKLQKGTSTGFVSHRLPFPAPNTDQGGGTGSGFSQSSVGFSNHLVQLLQQQQPAPAAVSSEPTQNKISPMSYGTGSFIPLNSEFVNDQRRAKEDRDTTGGEESSWNSGSGSDKTDQHNDQRNHNHGRFTPNGGNGQLQRSSPSMSTRSSNFGHTPPRGGNYQRSVSNSMQESLQSKQDRQNLSRGLTGTKEGGDLSDYYKDYGKVANTFVSTDIGPRLPGHGANFVSFPISNTQQQGYSNFPTQSPLRGNLGPMHNGNNVEGFNQHLSFQRGRRDHDGRWSGMGRGVRDRSATPDGLSSRNNNNRRNLDVSEKWEGKRFNRDPNLYTTSHHNSLDPLLERFRDGNNAPGGGREDKEAGIMNSNNPQGGVVTHTNFEQLFRQNIASEGLPPTQQRFRRPSPEESRGSNNNGSSPLNKEDFPGLESVRNGKPPNAPQSRSQTPNAMDRHNS